jgi:hypothetical protein
MGAPIRSPRVAGNAKEVSEQPKETGEILDSLRVLLVGDEREQRETFSFLRKALDEDRPSSRKLFPPT